jgi:UDP-N-acetylmuramoyl-tripeptide--D-alanyl-D-alanine ligase
MMMRLQHAGHLLASRYPGVRVVGNGDTPIARVHTDTRSLQTGDLFVALKGERFDAHDFVPQAKAAGAAAVMGSRGVEGAGLPGLVLPATADMVEALGALAAAWRAQFELPLIAVTGSNGKTTVTQMIGAVLRAWQGDAALATQGNFNNAIGVPLTLLRLLPNHRAAVVELGMNHPGEIQQLAAMARPSVALVNNAQREHQEFMASVEAVARENACVFDALTPNGVAVFPANDQFSAMWRSLAVAHHPARKTLTFALDARAGETGDVNGRAVWGDSGWDLHIDTPAGELDTRLQMAGRHNVLNALAAAACAIAAGAPLTAVAKGLAEFEPVKGRSRWLRRASEGRALELIDDAYNANPDSVRAAIDVLAALPAPRWLILGDMGEVGEQGPAFHREVGAYARQRKVDTLWTTGPLSLYAANSFGMAQQFESLDALVTALPQGLSELKPRSVLVKASRFMRFSQVVDALIDLTETRADETRAHKQESLRC